MTLPVGGTRSASQLEAVITIAEADMQAHNMPHGFPGRSGGELLEGFCGSASEIFSYYAQLNGLPFEPYQNRTIHQALAGESERRGPYGAQSFVHGLSLGEIGKQPYLVDLTVGQFAVQDTIRQAEKDSGIASHDPLVQNLIRTGYVTLDDETLRQYLRMTSCDNEGVGRAYIERATVTDLFRLAVPMEREIPPDDLVSGYEFHMPDTCADQPIPCTRPSGKIDISYNM